MIDLTELLRLIQFFNLGGLRCVPAGQTTEDGYIPGTLGETDCARHDSDYLDPVWTINLTELLRLIQFFNLGGYHACPDNEPPTEDGFCPGLVE